MIRKFWLTAMLAIAGLVWFNSYTLACSNPTDSFAAEVLANKPGVKYDLTKIKQAQNVEVENEAIVYRSHFNEAVAIVLTEEKGEILNGLSVRIQIPTKTVNRDITTTNVSFKLQDSQIKQIDRDFLSSLGYIVDVGEKNSERVSVKFISLRKDDVNVSIEEWREGDNDRIEFRANIQNADTLQPELREEFIKILDSLGIPENALDEATLRVDRFQETDLSSAIGIPKEEFNFPEATKAELEWLTEHHIISGLDQKDIEEISQKAKAGISGWNSRLVYEDGKWFPYYETGAPMLLRDNGGGCGGFNVDNMPEGRLLLSNPSNVTPKNRLAITWCRIKVSN